MSLKTHIILKTHERPTRVFYIGFKAMRTLIILCLLLELHGQTISLSTEQAQEMLKREIKLFKPVFLVAFDAKKMERDSFKKLDFMDLCKYPIKHDLFSCVAIHGETGWLKKYFIKTHTIKEAYQLFSSTDNLIPMPTTNLYDYGQTKSNQEDGVGVYYIWENPKRFWVIGAGYDATSTTIYSQKGDHIEVIDCWRLDW